MKTCEFCQDKVSLNDTYFESGDGTVYCLYCGNKYLEHSQYGWYHRDDDAVTRDPDMMLDDELVDIEFFNLKDRQLLNE
jgi:hypothetical protein